METPAATGWLLSSNFGGQKLQRIPGCGANSLDEGPLSRTVPLGPGAPHFVHSLLWPHLKWASKVHPSWGFIVSQPTSCWCGFHDLGFIALSQQCRLVLAGLVVFWETHVLQNLSLGHVREFKTQVFYL